MAYCGHKSSLKPMLIFNMDQWAVEYKAIIACICKKCLKVCVCFLKYYFCLKMYLNYIYIYIYINFFKIIFYINISKWSENIKKNSKLKKIKLS